MNLSAYASDQLSACAIAKLPSLALDSGIPAGMTEPLFTLNAKGGVSWIKGITQSQKDAITRRYFDHLSYDEKLEYCDRPEQIEGPSEKAWQEINAHLGTTANNIQQLIDQLGKKRFGHTPKVGDAFCGGGSLPFEAARIGCEAYGSDLNPVAALLTWASIHLIGGGGEVQKKVQAAQQAAFAAADEQITEWGIEHNEKGWRADAYLYCVEAVCPATGYLLPLAPSWVISEKDDICAVLKPDPIKKRYDIDIVGNVDQETFAKAKLGTVQNGRMVCPESGETFSIPEIRGDKRIDGKTIYGLRLWENEDLVPRPDDVFQERLYCVRWVETYIGNNAKGELVEKTRRHYCSVTQEDLQREQKVIELLEERLNIWQENGYIPSRKIERGYNTDQLIREKGWSYWHHLFAPRQLLLAGLLQELSSDNDRQIAVASYLGIAKIADWNSKLCAWMPHAGNLKGDHTFLNQALNTLYNFSVRPLAKIKGTWHSSVEYTPYLLHSKSQICTVDAREIKSQMDLWITDPPYADAVNYHELGEYFSSWYEKGIANEGLAKPIKASGISSQNGQKKKITCSA